MTEGKGFEEAVEAFNREIRRSPNVPRALRAAAPILLASFEEALLSPAARKAAARANVKAQRSGSRVYPSTAAIKAALATAKKTSQEGTG